MRERKTAACPLYSGMDTIQKIVTQDSARNIVNSWKKDGLRVVFTNGCFDILHAGHVQYLEAARNAGDRLVLGVNSDASVRRLKGEQRPVVQEEDRCRVLAALQSVDLVTVFDEDTPQELIELLLPNVLVKGADWAVENIVGAKTVMEHGGEVKTITFLEGRSTTGVIEKVLARCKA